MRSEIKINSAVYCLLLPGNPVFQDKVNHTLTMQDVKYRWGTYDGKNDVKKSVECIYSFLGKQCPASESKLRVRPEILFMVEQIIIIFYWASQGTRHTSRPITRFHIQHGVHDAGFGLQNPNNSHVLPRLCPHHCQCSQEKRGNIFLLEFPVRISWMDFG